jgi:hypothetical protein
MQISFLQEKIKVYEMVCLFEEKVSQLVAAL